MDIRDRIIELRRVKGSELVPNPKNWRRHPQAQRDALKGVVSEIGFAGAELTFTLPDGRLMLIDGHMRAEDFKDSVLPVLVTDLTPEEADTILLTFDPISSQATADREKLAALMQDVQSGEAGVQAMLAELAEREKLVLPDVEPPEEFPSYDEDIETEYCCPKCGYEWSGKPK